MDKVERRLNKALAAVLSLLLPGLGQALQKDWKRGLSILLAIGTALATVSWYGKREWFILIVLLWLWNVWDAFQMPRGAPIPLAVLLWLAMAYGIGWQVTQVNPMALFANAERAQSIIRPMLQPDFLTARKEKHEGWVEVQVPCSPNPPRAEKTVGGITVRVQPDCGNLNETLIVTAEGLWPNAPTEITWMTPIGDVKLLGPGNNQMLVVQSDESGRLSVVIQVPGSALAAAPDPTLPLPHRVYLTQTRPIGGMTLSTNGQYVIRGIYETLALALLSTVIGAVLAIPFGFLAARNLMSGHPALMGIYVVVRTILNVVRSIESLILAIIFVIIVGLGPFPGMLALALHTTAALGKLYSEVIEAIDPGPIEAIRATGANSLQVIRYAVIPQIIPPFTALTIYRWDINVRSSTIIGFVGGGGIGFFLYQWILIGDFRAVSASFIAIAAVVMVLDFFSAKLRERLV